MDARLSEKNLRKRLGDWYYFGRHGQDLVEEARTAANDAVQHRGFKVGALALALSEEGNVGLFTGANYMPQAGGPKVCAEQAALAKVASHGFSRVVALVVSGPLQPDKHSGIELPTLHPCGDCRQLIDQSPLVQDSTLVMPVHPTADIYELYTRRELANIHGASSSEDAPEASMHYVDPHFQSWYRGINLLGQLAAKSVPNVRPEVLVRASVTGQLNSVNC